MTILLYLGKAILFLFFADDFFQLPLALAISSWLFFGFVAFFPAWLLRQHLSFTARALLVLFTCTMPIGLHQQYIVGHILNTGYLFYILAFWIIIYLKLEEPKGLPNFFASAGFILCLLTNPTVASLFLLFFPFSFHSAVALIKRNLLLLLTSGAILFVIGLRMYIIGSITGGHREVAGTSATYIEFWIGRSLVFPFFACFYAHLTDALCICFAVLLLGLTAILPDVKLRKICWWVALAYLLQVAVLFITRLNINSFLQNYTSSFPGQYFMAPNWLATIWVSFLIAGFRNRIITIVVVGLYLIQSYSYHHQFLRRGILLTAIGPWQQSTCWAIKNPEQAILRAKHPLAHYLPLEIYPGDRTWYYYITMKKAEELRARCP